LIVDGLPERVLCWLYQLRGRRVERGSETEDRAERCIAFRALEVSDLVAMKTGFLSQVLL
jgi:hypothetical protein